MERGSGEGEGEGEERGRERGEGAEGRRRRGEREGEGRRGVGEGIREMLTVRGWSHMLSCSHGPHSPSARLCSDVDFPVNGFPMKLAFSRKWGKLGGAGGGRGGSTRSRRRYTTWERIGLGGRGNWPVRDSGGHQSHRTFCVCMCVHVCIVYSICTLHCACA